MVGGLVLKVEICAPSLFSLGSSVLRVVCRALRLRNRTVLTSILKSSKFSGKLICLVNIRLLLLPIFLLDESSIATSFLQVWHKTVEINILNVC